VEQPRRVVLPVRRAGRYAGASASPPTDAEGRSAWVLSHGFVVLDQTIYRQLGAGFGRGPTTDYQGTRGQLLMHGCTSSYRRRDVAGQLGPRGATKAEARVTERSRVLGERLTFLSGSLPDAHVASRLVHDTESRGHSMLVLRAAVCRPSQR
jgi:hypothetical protein